MTNKKFRATEEQRYFILKHYKGISNKELTNMFNKHFNTEITVQQIKTHKHNRKLDSGLTSHFEKGHNTFNKGLKWEDYMSKEAQANSKKTTFKKGIIPLNTKEVGSEYVDADGYLYIKVKSTGNKRFSKGGMWQQKHRLIWEEHYGEIPEGYAIIFLDRDKRNFDINNLRMVNRNELVLINKLGLTEDKDINEFIIALSKVKHKLRKVSQNLGVSYVHNKRMDSAD